MKSTLLQEIQLPLPISQEQVLKLYNELRHSEVVELRERAANDIIKHHLRLGMSICFSFKSKTRSRLDDLVSVMSLSLVKGVREIEKGAIDSHQNVTGYLVTTIRGDLLRFICKDRLVAVGIEHAKKKEVKKLYFPESIEETVSLEGTSFVELRELLESLHLNPTERKIVGCRMDGLNDRETAKWLAAHGKPITPAWVGQIRASIAKRLVELMK